MNNRVYKFRAWDGKKMDYEPTCCTDGPEVTGLNSNIANLFEDWHSPKYEALMQFTGLNDKNGKEIYDNDCVKSDKGIIMIVIWSKNLGRWSLTYKNVWSDKPGSFFKGLNKDWSKKVEVIGNTFENPLLIKDKS